MGRKENPDYTKRKREFILESARTVFCRKGLIGVTMKDITEECGISRGGIYLYYNSVDEVFMDTAKQRTSRKFDHIRRSIEKDVSFDELIESYFAGHKDRLLNHMEGSMLRSMYEYFFTHKTEADRKFQQEQLVTVQQTIYEILMLGIRQHALHDKGIKELAENFMFVIEGLSVLALIGGVTEEHVDRQFNVMRSQLPRKGQTKCGAEF